MSESNFAHEYLTNRVIRTRNQQCYYFNEEGIYTAIDTNKIDETKFSGFSKNLEGTAFALGLDQKELGITKNHILLKRIVCMLKLGDSIEKFYHYLKTVTLDDFKSKGVELFIVGNGPITFLRNDGNNNKNTFDYVIVELFIKHTWEEGTKEDFAKKHSKELIKRAAKQLQKSHRLDKYNLNINSLKIKSVIITKDDRLIFDFELKK